MLPSDDLQLRWPASIFRAEARSLLSDLDRGSADWCGSAVWLLQEAFTSPAPAGRMAQLWQASRTGSETWGSPWSTTADSPETRTPDPSSFLEELAGSAQDFAMEEEPRPYWSQRHAAEDVAQRLGGWFLHTIRDLVDRGYFEQALPSGCEDDNLSDAPHPSTVLHERLGVTGLWPLPESLQVWDPTVHPDVFYDLVEVLHDLVARPRSRTFHDYWNHWHYENFNRGSGQALYRWRVNQILGRAGVDLRLADAGEDTGRLIHVTDDTRHALIERVQAVAADRDARQHAVALFRSRIADRESKRSAIVALARLLEDRRSLLDANLLSKDEGALFQIANQFDLRHNKADQQRDYDEAYLDWIFWWYLATLDLTDTLLRRKDANG